jgi:hypothetical protein
MATLPSLAGLRELNIQPKTVEEVLRTFRLPMPWPSVRGRSPDDPRPLRASRAGCARGLLGMDGIAPDVGNVGLTIAIPCISCMTRGLWSSRRPGTQNCSSDCVPVAVDRVRRLELQERPYIPARQRGGHPADDGVCLRRWQGSPLAGRTAPPTHRPWRRCGAVRRGVEGE